MVAAVGRHGPVMGTAALTNAPKSRHTRSNMPAPAPVLGTIRPIRGRPSTSGHPFMVALQAKGRTLTTWAEDHGLSRAKVKGWVAPTDGSGARRIPRAWAEKIETELGIPASLASWPQGIS